MPNFAIKASVGFGGPRVALVNYFAGKPENHAVNDITEGEANARLIASAPQLLAALQALVDCPDYRGIKTHEMDAARAALAAAQP